MEMVAQASASGRTFTKTITVNLLGSFNMIPGVLFPSRQGTPQDLAKLLRQIIENDMLNGEAIRLDWPIRTAPK